MTQSWGWRRWIAAGEDDEWIERLQAVGCANWTLTERPDRKRILLAVYDGNRDVVIALRDQFGGTVRAVPQSAWLPAKPALSTRIGQHLEIVHDVTRRKTKPPIPQLLIPHGLAFGSGDHATTFMLLRALCGLTPWNEKTVLDLGTGSGVLALAARLLGARKIVANDFDPKAIRTARQNEALNFSAPKIDWHCADVRKIRSANRYDLVLANLFSGILCESAPQIATCASPGGQLWLSGILRSQQEEVITAYRGQGMQLARAARRGKWVMLQWTAPIKSRRAPKRKPPR